MANAILTTSRGNLLLTILALTAFFDRAILMYRFDGITTGGVLRLSVFAILAGLNYVLYRRGIDN